MTSVFDEIPTEEDDDEGETPTITALTEGGRLHFTVRFSGVEMGAMIQDMHTVPSRRFDGRDLDYKFIVQLAGSRHLLAFAEKYQIEAPPELIEDAAKCPDDGLEILPQSARHLDFAKGKFVARFPVRDIGEQVGNGWANKDFRRMGEHAAKFNTHLRLWEVENYPNGIAALKKIVDKWEFDVSDSAWAVLFPGLARLAADNGLIDDPVLALSNLPKDAGEELRKRWMDGYGERIKLNQGTHNAVQGTNAAFSKYLQDLNEAYDGGASLAESRDE